jgi:hypothetical protein
MKGSTTKLASCVVAVGMTLIAGAQQAAAPATASSEELVELDTALVIGEQPGPGLWKVTKGDNVMWVLADYGPLPKDMIWHSAQVEARIAESQEVLYPPNVNIHPSIGIARAITLIPSALKVGKNPDGASLQEVLDADTYARWATARDKVITKKKEAEDLEEWRPGIAVAQLQGMAFAKNGLVNGQVSKVVREATKKHKVRVNRLPTLDRAVKWEDPRGMLKNAARKLGTPEIDCFRRSLDTLEPGIETAKARANAWARGDIAKLRALHREFQPKDDCIYIMITGFTELGGANAASAKKMLADMEWHAEQGRVQAQRDWVAAAQVALGKNRSTFSVLPVGDVLRADGHLAKLRAMGYTVEDPI